MTAEPKEPRLDHCRKPEDRDQEQGEHSYYYDDAHGYEAYDPSSDDDEEIEGQRTPPNGDPDQKSK